MAGKIKLKKAQPYNPARDTVPAVVHDRRAQDLNRGVVGHVEVLELDDPMGLNPGDKVVVLRNLRSDPLAQLQARGNIDDAQYAGGRDYQKYFERAESPIRAIDYGKVQVDGGLPPEDITDGQIKAVSKLKVAHEALGTAGTRIVQEVLVHGLSMEQVANARNMNSLAYIKYFGKRFRECLETLAMVYGHTNTRKLLSET